MITKDYTKSNFVWNAVGNITYMMCQWLITVLVPILGGFGDAGILSVAMSVSATCQTIGMFGIRNFQVSDVEGKYHNSCYVGLRAITCGAAMVACLVFSLVSGYHFNQVIAILLFMTFRLAETYSDVLHGIAQKNGRLYIGGISFFIKGVGLLVSFLVAFLLSKNNLNAGLLAMTAFSCATVVLYDLPQVRKIADFRLTDSLGRCGRLALETLPLCIYLFLYSAIFTLPKLILGDVSGESILGAYSSIYAPAMLLQAASTYLYTPFATNFGDLRQKGDKKAFRSLLLKIVIAILIMSAVVLVMALLLGEFALVLVFGEKIRPYAGYLLPILLVNIGCAYFGFFCMLSIVLRAFRWLLSGCFVGFFLSVLLTKPAIRMFDVNGTSYSVVFATVVASIVLLIGIMISFSKMKPNGEFCPSIEM